MPAQERLGLDDQEGRAPGAEATGQEHEQGAIGRGAARPPGAAAQDGQLVAEERVLCHQRRPTPDQVGEAADSQRGNRRAGGGEEPPMEAAHDGAADSNQTMQRAD